MSYPFHTLFIPFFHVFYLDAHLSVRCFKRYTIPPTMGPEADLLDFFENPGLKPSDRRFEC